MLQDDLKKIFENDAPAAKYQIFCDMDGVLTDFPKQFMKYTGAPMEGYEEKYGKAAFWSAAEKAGEKFWTEMDWMPDGKELWNYIQPHDPVILSAPSRDPKCITGKVKWCKEHLNLSNHNLQLKSGKGWDGKSRILLNSNKYAYARNKNDILIDDTDKKLNAWIQHGGTGILHTSAADTIKKLKELGI